MRLKFFALFLSVAFAYGQPNGCFIPPVLTGSSTVYEGVYYRYSLSGGSRGLGINNYYGVGSNAMLLEAFSATLHTHYTSIQYSPYWSVGHGYSDINFVLNWNSSGSIQLKNVKTCSDPVFKNSNTIYVNFVKGLAGPKTVCNPTAWQNVAWNGPQNIGYNWTGPGNTKIVGVRNAHASSAVTVELVNDRQFRFKGNSSNVNGLWVFDVDISTEMQPITDRITGEVIVPRFLLKTIQYQVWFGPPPAATGDFTTNFSIPWDYLTGTSNCTPIQFTFSGNSPYFLFSQQNPGVTTYNWSTFGQGTLTAAGAQYVDPGTANLDTQIPTVNYHPPSSPFGSQGAISVRYSNACGTSDWHYVPTSVPNEYAIPAFNNTGGCNRSGGGSCPPPCPPEEGFSVSPNPADGELTIALDELTNQPQAIAVDQAKAKDVQRTYQIFNTGGRLMRSGTISGARDNVSLSGLPTGTYHLVLLENGKMAGRKTFMKQ